MNQTITSPLSPSPLSPSLPLSPPPSPLCPSPLSPSPSPLSQVLPQSGSHNISSFCRELAKVVRDSSKHKAILLYEEELVSALVIQNFYSGVFTESQFAMELEKALIDSTDVFGVELDALHRICWVYYREAKKSVVSFPKWLTGTCTYRLWLVFNQCLDDSLTYRMSPVTMNEVLKRIIELCSYTWNDKYDVDPEERKDFSFPEFLICITDYFDRFNLDMSLTCEVRCLPLSFLLSFPLSPSLSLSLSLSSLSLSPSPSLPLSLSCSLSPSFFAREMMGGALIF